MNDYDRPDEAYERGIFDGKGFVEKVLGDVSVAQRIALHALDDIERNHGGLIAAIGAEDAETGHFYAHSLKGVASLVVCERLLTCATKIDQMAKDRNLRDAKRELVELERVLRKTRRALQLFTSSGNTDRAG